MSLTTVMIVPVTTILFVAMSVVLLVRVLMDMV